MKDWTKTNGDGLFDLDSPLDLLLRGYSRDDIKTRTGTDVGYNGISVSKHLKGIDRMGYRSSHLRGRYSREQILDLLDKYAHGMSRVDVLSEMGICGEHPSMRSIFESCGFGDEFKSADRMFRKNNMRDGCIEKYGVDNVFKLQEFQDAAADKREALYGAKYTLQNGSVLDDDVRNTYMEHMSNADFKDAVMEKRRATCIERYGVEYYAQTDEFRKLQSGRMLDPDYQQHITSTKRENGTLNTSSEEKMFYDMLLNIYASDDVECQYYDERYPFACDFYIKSRDLFIELNISWTHGGGWYDGREVMCKPGSKYYDNAIFNWTQRDVNKRNAARDNNLNYVVFWLPKCLDAVLWFAMGCPDGHDWEREYSWIPLRRISVPDVIPKKGSSARNCIKAAKAIHGSLFYEQELCMWNDNVLLLGKGRIQGLLYSNRYKYLGKLPD